MLKKNHIFWFMFYGVANTYNLFQIVLSYVLDREPGTTIFYWVSFIIVALFTVVFVYCTWKAAKIEHLSAEIDTISAYQNAVISGNSQKFWDDFDKRFGEASRIFPWSK